MIIVLLILVQIKITQEGEQTPKLFSEEEYFEETSTKSYDEENKSDELFENDNSEEEDFEIPAFLRRQKF